MNDYFNNDEQPKEQEKINKLQDKEKNVKRFKNIGDNKSFKPKESMNLKNHLSLHHTLLCTNKKIQMFNFSLSMRIPQHR